MQYLMFLWSLRAHLAWGERSCCPNVVPRWCSKLILQMRGRWISSPSGWVSFPHHLPVLKENEVEAHNIVRFTLKKLKKVTGINLPSLFKSVGQELSFFSAALRAATFPFCKEEQSFSLRL